MRNSLITGRCISVLGAVVLVACVLGFLKPADADNFGNAYYDAGTDELVVTMQYGGTNPDHKFSIKWDACKTLDSGEEPIANGVVLDDQFKDAAQQQFSVETRISMAGMPCSRPAQVALTTPPNYHLQLEIPAK